MSIEILLRAIYETAKISLPTVLEARRKSLRQEDCDKRLRTWSRSLLADAEVSLRISGSVPQTGSCLVLSNHESVYDIPVIFQTVPFGLRMAAKAELFRVPVWGKAMLDAGFVPIDRGRATDARARLDGAMDRLLAEQRGLWMAPEGTRNDGASLLPFKSGAFDIAMRFGVDIVPVSLRGTSRILPRGASEVARGVDVQVHFHERLHPSAFANRNALRDAVRKLIEEGCRPGLAHS